MIIVGLTGGIGTGKTEVTRILRELGAQIISADEVAHQVYEPRTEGWREVVEEFGESILGADGEVDRSKLGEIVFDDQRALDRLNAIVHPRARASVETRIRELKGRGERVVVVEAPLLVEARWTDMVDEVWVTKAAQGQVVERVKCRDGIDAEVVRARVRTQISEAERLAHADAVIDNSGSIEELERRIQGLCRDLTTSDRKHTRKI